MNNEQNVNVQSVREADIYRQFAVTLMTINNFIYDEYTQKHSLNASQAALALLGGISDRYMAKRSSDDDKAPIEKLIKDAKAFCSIRPEKTTNYTSIKLEAGRIIDEYDRILLKVAIFK